MKILLVCVHFHSSFGWSIQRALNRAGHEVRIFDYRHNPFRHFPGLREYYSSRLMPQRLMEAARSFKPELVFLAKAELVPGGLLKTIREQFGCRITNWFPDGRLFAYEKIVDQIPHLDYFFSKNSLDLDRLKLLGFQNGRFLPHCADLELHTNLVTRESDLADYRCQVALVGSYYPYRDAIAAQLLDFDIRIWGTGWSRSEVARKSGAVVGKEARSEEQAKVFRGAIVNLNTHHYDDIQCLNQRVFDICGSGGCQILDGFRNVETVYRVPDEVETFHSAQELREKIQRLLEDPKRAREMGQRSLTKTAAAHTYDHRVGEILAVLRC